MLLAKICLFSGLKKNFSYLVPEMLETKVETGSLVIAPFKNKEVLGFVDSLEKYDEKQEKKFSLKSLKEVLDYSSLINPEDVKEIRWISEYYKIPFSSVIKAYLPKNISFSKKTDNGESKLCLEERSLKKELFFKIVQELSEETLMKKDQTSQRFYRFILSKGKVTRKELREEFRDYRRIFGKFLKSGIISELEEERSYLFSGEFREPVENVRELTEFQQKAIEKVTAAIDKGYYEAFLLYGVTGSGKTEVYLRLIEKALSLERQSLLLVPEISLTPQLIHIFSSRFSEKLSLLHSKLSAQERSRQWKKISTGQARIILGVRSAVFAPMSRPGLIIVDEEHEHSFKQDSRFLYNARDMAVIRAKNKNIPVILGSATPSLETFRNCEQKKYTLLELPKRISRHGLPEVVMVNLREMPGDTILSELLLMEMHKTLQARKKVLLFLNRKGFSNATICPSCHEAIKCPNCSVALKFHKTKQLLKCHYCDYITDITGQCPVCMKNGLLHLGFGTEKIESELFKFFPSSKLLRIDSETMLKQEDYDNFYRKIKSDCVDIIIGTQIISKGLDISDITLVGVIMADFSLNIPDFRASEKTFQLLTQVAGRAGRANEKGKVIIQTINPKHPALIYSVSQDFREFYKYESGFRKATGYPPYTKMVNFRFSALKEEVYSEILLRYSRSARIFLKESGLENSIKLLGPSENPISRLNGKFRWQMLLVSGHFKQLSFFTDRLICHFNENYFGKGVALTVDVDPVNFF